MLKKKYHQTVMATVTTIKTPHTVVPTIRSERLRSVRLHRSGSVSLKKAREEEQREGGREHEVDHQIGNG
jgi:hypothetical protein